MNTANGFLSITPLPTDTTDVDHFLSTYATTHVTSGETVDLDGTLMFETDFHLGAVDTDNLADDLLDLTKHYRDLGHALVAEIEITHPGRRVLVATSPDETTELDVTVAY